MTIQLISTAILIIFVSGCVGQQKPQHNKSDSITSISSGGALLLGFNRNDDYQIDQNEFEAGRTFAFNSADLNSDGAINISEFRSWHAQAIGARGALPNMVYFDRNLNDQISQEEFYRGLDRLFFDLDENQDYIVSYDEVITMVSAPTMRPRGGRRPPEAGGQGRRDRPGQVGF